MISTLKFKIPKEVLDFYFQNGTLIDDRFAFIPYWFEIVDKEKNVVIMHRLGDEMPTELKTLINNQREMK